MSKAPTIALWISSCLVVALTGCSKEQDSRETQRNIGDAYLRGTLGVAQTLQGNLGVMAIEKAIGTFKMQHGRNPSSLQELQQIGYLPKMPDPPIGREFSYDPEAGTVSVVQQQRALPVQ